MLYGSNHGLELVVPYQLVMTIPISKLSSLPLFLQGIRASTQALWDICTYIIYISQIYTSVHILWDCLCVYTHTIRYADLEEHPQDLLIHKAVLKAENNKLSNLLI